jgi:hypothetical protein
LCIHIACRNAPRPTAPTRGRGFGIQIWNGVSRHAKRGRQNRDINRRFFGYRLRSLFPRTTIPCRAILATLVLLRLLIAGVRAAGAAVVRHISIIAIITLPFIPARLTVFFKARAVFRNDAEIMVGELEIIFGENTIALQLRFARQIFIFLKKLGSIATRPIIDAAAIILTPAIILGPTAAAASTVRLTIVKQVIQSSNQGVVQFSPTLRKIFHHGTSLRTFHQPSRHIAYSPVFDEISGAVSSFPANGASPFGIRPSIDHIKTKRNYGIFRNSKARSRPPRS